LTTQAAQDLDLNYDFRRVDAVVVSGYQDRPGRVPADRAQKDQVLHVYNSHRSRIKVLTYADVLEAVERAIQFDA
jgi:hypothetical protein